MKKRLISFFMALAFVFSFPLSASAVSVIGIINGFLTAFEFAQVFIKMDRQDIVNPLSDEDFQALRDNYLAQQKQALSNTNDDSSWKSDLKPIEFYLKMSAETWGAPSPTAGNYHYMIWAINTGDGYYQINVRIIYDTSHYDDWNYFYSIHNEPCVERSDRANFSCLYCQIIDAIPLGGTTCRAINGTYYVQKNGCYTNQNMDASNVYCYATDMVEAPLTFTSTISLDRTERGGQSHLWLNITLDSNKTVEHDIIALGGVLYDDGTNRGLINADYVDGKSLQGGTHWEWKYDMNGFSGWAYRKHLGLNNFYGFVSVEGDAGGTHMINVVYANEKLLDLPPPDFGPFADVQELPDYEDYKPTPTTYPTLPDNTFDFTPNNNYTTYNYDTVNNYDSTTQNFNEWLGDTITIINNNVSGGLDSIDNNLRIIGDNINDFSTSVKNYIEGGSVALNEYIGDLIIKFNNDFLAWSDSFGIYLGDVLGTINFNTQLIADNILNFIKVQFVPDDDYLNLLLMECCPWYYQVKDVLNEVISDSSAVDHLSINFSIPSLDYEGSAVFEDDELASLIRNTFQVILVAGTVIGCVRLGFQIFGINIKAGQGVE